MPKWRLRFVPRDESFFELFIRQADNIEAAAATLHDLLGEGGGGSHHAVRLRDLEHEGDEITHEVLRRLNTVFVTPLDHEDIHRLASSLDDVLDHMEAAGDLFDLYKMDDALPVMRQQSEILVRATHSLREAVGILPRYSDLRPYWVEMNRIENEGDRVYRQAEVDLFTEDHRAMDVLKWAKIIDEMEAAVDKVEDVANVLEAIALKHA